MPYVVIGTKVSRGVFPLALHEQACPTSRRGFPQWTWRQCNVIYYPWTHGTSGSVGTMHGPVEQHRFLSPMGDGVKWGPSRNCPQICGDCERGLDPAGVILPEASSTPRISSESLAAAGYFKKTHTGRFDLV